MRGAGHVLPHPSIIARYYALGGRMVTLGSDAHTPERVGAHILDAIGILRKIGFREFATFTARIPSFIPSEYDR